MQIQEYCGSCVIVMPAGSPDLYDGAAKEPARAWLLAILRAYRSILTENEGQ